MPRWQYCEIDLNDLPSGAGTADALEGAGEEGWELVTITNKGIAYLKRQTEAPARAPASPVRRRKTRPSVE
jgi:hypothetical protein